MPALFALACSDDLGRQLLTSVRRAESEDSMLLLSARQHDVSNHCMLMLFAASCNNHQGRQVPHSVVKLSQVG